MSIYHKRRLHAYQVEENKKNPENKAIMSVKNGKEL